jgi:hypothetical protein
MKCAPPVRAALVLALLGGCGAPAPLGPSPADQGIIVYIHSGFAGTSQAVSRDVSNLSDVEGPCAEGDDASTLTWNDCISSVRVLPGWGATLYGDRNYRGATLEIVEDVLDLKAIGGPCSGSYNDCISSIRVYRR